MRPKIGVFQNFHWKKSLTRIKLELKPISYEFQTIFINFCVTKFNLVFCVHFIYSCDKQSTWTFENSNIHHSTNIFSDCNTFRLSLIHSKHVSYLQLVNLIISMIVLVKLIWKGQKQFFFHILYIACCLLAVLHIVCICLVSRPKMKIFTYGFVV